MARYSIIYFDPVNQPGKKQEHVLEAASDAQARIRFLNLSWVAFTAIYIDSVALKADQPAEAKAAAKKNPLAGIQRHAYRGRYGADRIPCRECGEPRASRVHSGFEPVLDQAPDRANDGASDAAVKAAAAGIARPDPAVVLAAPAATRPRVQNRRGSAFDRAVDNRWEAEVDRLTDEIGRLADQAQALTRLGKHAEADELRKQARGLAADRAAITKRNVKRK